MRLHYALLLAIAPPLAAQSHDCDGYFTALIAPAGTCVRVLADSLGPVRQIVVHPSGQIVIATDSAPGLLRLTDGNRNGKAGTVIRFGPGLGGTGVTWRNGWLYFAADSAVVRYRWPADAAAPDSEPEWISRALPVSDADRAHNAKGIAVGSDGMVYVTIGSMSDDCQVKFVAQSAGRWPCTELDHRAGVWRFVPPTEPGGAWVELRFASGIRNAEALAIDPVTDHLWAAAHGRDYLGTLWHWSDSPGSAQPADFLEQVVQNDDYGWPYCQGAWARNLTQLVKAPEYAKQPGVDCTLKTAPVMGFAPHSSPTALAVVNSTAAILPHPGLFVAFHGPDSASSSPGGFIMFVPIDDNGRPSGETRIIVHSGVAAAAFHPAGIAVTLDGTLYVTDPGRGLLYRIEPHAAAIH